jgi:tripartite-type tricarboxylate transporter receptor subunit TctC
MLPRRMNHVDSGAMKRILACALAVFALTAYAQTYPSRPIKFVAPFPPGGSSDVLCRLLGAKLAEGLGQPVTVENRPGAAASIGHQYAAQQPPDGYTIVITSSSTLVNNLYLYKHQAFDVFTDFAPISMIASAGQVLVVHPSVPAKSVRELIALAKAQPGKLNFASAGVGGLPHLAGELFKLTAKIDIVHVPYRGAAPAINDLLGHQVQMTFLDLPVILPQIKAGNLRPIALGAKQRAAQAPDVPTTAEVGMPELLIENWYGMIAPAATPPDIIARLNSIAREAMSDASVEEKLADQGLTLVPQTPEQFRAYIVSETAKWAKVIKDAGVPTNK